MSNHKTIITHEVIEKTICKEVYFTAADGAYGAWRLSDIPMQSITCALLGHTFCVLELNNGFTVSGESICVNYDDIDAERERKIARNNAIQKAFQFAVYEKRIKLVADEEALRQAE